MTIRLTDAQMTVLRALDKLPEGEWITAKEGGFSANSANALNWHRSPTLVTPDWGKYTLAPAGRALIATLKAEGRW